MHVGIRPRMRHRVRPHCFDLLKIYLRLIPRFSFQEKIAYEIELRCGIIECDSTTVQDLAKGQNTEFPTSHKILIYLSEFLESKAEAPLSPTHCTQTVTAQTSQLIRWTRGLRTAQMLTSRKFRRTL
jgi:hypothetical protein